MSHNENDWILRVGDGQNFNNSSNHEIWGVKSNCCKNILKRIRSGDRLWFVKNGSGGKLIGVSIYCSHNTRVFGPLLNISMTDKELGWTSKHRVSPWDIEIHYTDLYRLEHLCLLTYIKGQTPVREYNENCKIDLLAEYNMIKLD